MKITIIMYVWGELRWLLTPSLLSLKRHWPEMVEEDLVIISESPIDSPLPAKNIVYPKIVKDWSGAIKSTLQGIKTDIVFLINVDFFLVSPVDTKKLKTLISYIMTDPNILQGYVFCDPSVSRETFLKHHKFVRNWNGLRIVRCKHWMNCSIEDGGIVLPLFKRELIVNLLRPSLNIQDAEQNLIQDVRKTNLYGVTTDPPLFNAVELHTSFSNGYWHLELLDKQDQKIIEKYKPKSVKFMINYDVYETHLPVLIWLGQSLNIKRVLEFGCGLYSTVTFLDRDIFPKLEFLHSIENNMIWIDKLTEIVENDERFLLTYTDKAINEIISDDLVSNYDLIFIDDSQGVEERTKTIRAISNYAKLLNMVVIHDYEQLSYQKAANGFNHSFNFNALTPNTGILWNDKTLIDKNELERINK